MPPTTGTLTGYAANGAPLGEIVTLEEPWKNNQRSVSCIPPGVYQVAPWNSAKHPGTLQVVGEEPERGAVLIHSGNTLSDTAGCILTGSRFARDAAGHVTGTVDSRAALREVVQWAGSGAWLVITADAAHSRTR